MEMKWHKRKLAAVRNGSDTIGLVWDRGLQVLSHDTIIQQSFQLPKPKSPGLPPRGHNVLKPKCCASVSCHLRQLKAALAKGHLINMFFYAVSRTQPRHLLKSLLRHVLHQSLRSWVTRSLGCSSKNAAKLKRSTTTSAPHGMVRETGGGWWEIQVQIRQPRACQAHFTTPLIKVNEYLPVSHLESAATKNTRALFYFS